jgi:hypothetical protein
MRLRTFGVLAAALSVCAISAVQATAKTVNVRPTKAHALQKGIDRAGPGDRVAVHPGRYDEVVEVDKRVHIVGVGKRRPVIDGSCRDRLAVVDVTHSGVTLRHLKVKGADGESFPGFAVNMVGLAHGTIEDIVMQQSCPDEAEYGANVNVDGDIQILDNKIFGGFEDAGIYVGSIADTLGGTLRVNGNESYANSSGILIEDSFGNDQRIVVRNNDTHDNHGGRSLSPGTGIFVHDSDLGVYTGNTMNDNQNYGVHFDTPSDDNVFNENKAARNGVANKLDEGTGNCGAGNVGFSMPPC